MRFQAINLKTMKMILELNPNSQRREAERPTPRKPRKQMRLA
jgi:hypothetical protein